MSSLDPVQNVLGRLENWKPAGDHQYMARCPAHDDRHASLSVGRGSDGRALLDCKAGCAVETIVTAMGLTMSDLFPPTGMQRPVPVPRKPIKKTIYKTAEEAFASVTRYEGQFVASWSYPGGTFLIGRFEKADGTKSYRPVHQTDSGWVLADPPEPLPLYCGDKLPATGVVVVVEGEKCCDAAATVGLYATTSSHGAGTAHKSDWSALAGRDVVILPDVDTAGEMYVKEVTAILAKLSPPAKVKIVRLPGLAAHGDIADWISPDGPMGCKDAEEIKAAVMNMVQAATPVAPPSVVTPVITCMADVMPEPVKWLWPNRIAIGKLTILSGDPGLGKSFITLDLAARVSKGTYWPDCTGSSNVAGGVVLLSAEDDLADTIRPRLDAAGANVNRINALTAVKRIDPGTRRICEDGFNLAVDLQALEQAILKVDNCRLVVVDPITAYLGKADSYKNSEMRALLAPLSELASRHGVAVVAVSHLRKGDGPAMYRTMGSMAFVAAARAAYAVTKDKDDPSGVRRLVLPIKNNLGNDQTGLAYSLDSTFSLNRQPVVRWEPEPVEISADEALRPRPQERDEDSGELGEANRWLLGILADGPVAAKVIMEKARKDGISKRTLDRAKKQANVIAAKGGFKVGWTWCLSGHEGRQCEERQDHQIKTLATFEDVGNLYDLFEEKQGVAQTESSQAGEGCQAIASGNLRQTPDQPGSVDSLDAQHHDRIVVPHLTNG
jgi:hypothetical protein